MEHNFASAIERIDTTLQTVLLERRIAGIAVGVIRDGIVTYARGYGVRQLGADGSVDTRTLFHMASVSKTFVATAIMTLVERGLVNLSAPLTTYLPYFELSDERYRDITVRHMLSHTSGLPDVEDYEWHIPEYDDGALERLVRASARLRLNSAPGEKHAYSNLAYEMLGAMIAQVSGQTFESFVKTTVLEPAGMKDSTFLRAEVNPDLATAGHVGEGEDGRGIQAHVSAIYPYSRRHAPSSTLHSNIEDLSRYALLHLQHGELEGRCVLQARSYYALWHPYTQDGEADRFRGLSWSLSTERGVPLISHGGGDVGFASMLCLYPQQNAATIILSNNDWGLFDLTPVSDAARDAAFAA